MGADPVLDPGTALQSQAECAYERVVSPGLVEGAVPAFGLLTTYMQRAAWANQTHDGKCARLGIQQAGRPVQIRGAALLLVVGCWAVASPASKW